MLYRGGEGVEKDHAEAARWLHAAAEQADTQSQWYLGQWYRDGEGVPADYVTAYAWLNIAAASALGSAERDELAEQMTAGQIAAAQRMARELSERIDVGTDKTRAEAETGDADAQYWLGWTYRFGQVERNDVEAARWYRAAAEQGHAHAQFTLSAMHVAGEGVPKDVSEAVRWYRLAAEQSEASPWMQLAIMYAIGYEVEPDHTEAARWFREGIAISHHKRGRMLHSRGDYVDAARWLRAAAQQGETQSQWYLGRMYREGEGVPADYVTSYAWLDVASQDRANIPALERDHLATRMTTRQSQMPGAWRGS